MAMTYLFLNLFKFKTDLDESCQLLMTIEFHAVKLLFIIPYKIDFVWSILCPFWFTLIINVFHSVIIHDLFLYML